MTDKNKKGIRHLSLLILLALFGGVFWGYNLALDQFAGDSHHDPEDSEWLLSDAAQGLVDKAYEGIDAGSIRDYHSHLLRFSSQTSEPGLNPNSYSWQNPWQAFKTRILMRACGIKSRSQANEEYIARLVRLIRSMPGYSRHHLLAFDKHYRPDGKVDQKRTAFYTSNDSVFDVAEQHPDLFIPAISIHPYRNDAIEALHNWADKGASLLKWLPNTQGIDPADSRLLPFYQAMKERNITLISHAGEETVIDQYNQQALGNPLRLRQALDAGVKVIVAHAASLGENPDLDDPQRRPVSNMTLFLRMMDEKQYEGLLFGEISSITLNDHSPHAIEALLQRPDLHHRLVNGSDYPLPAINALIDLDELVEDGLIDPAQAAPLREIYAMNPLLFDFVLKRHLRLPGTKLGFAKEVFLAKPGLSDR